MDTMYALLMRKKWREKGPFLTPKLVNYYLQATTGGINDFVFPYKIDAIIIFPGYLSKYANKKANNIIMNFWSNFFAGVGPDVECIIAEGMNGNSKKSLGVTLGANVRAIGKIRNRAPLLLPSSKDHSKSIFFLQSKDDSSMGYLEGFFETSHLGSIFSKKTDNALKEDKEHKKESMGKYKKKFDKKFFASIIKNNFKTKAILVGSSNLSYQTYYKSPADKGETDVFLFDIDEEEKAIEFEQLIIDRDISKQDEISLFKEVEKIDLHKIMSDEIDELETCYGL